MSSRRSWFDRWAMKSREDTICVCSNASHGRLPLLKKLERLGKALSPMTWKFAYEPIESPSASYPACIDYADRVALDDKIDMLFRPSYTRESIGNDNIRRLFNLH